MVMPCEGPFESGCLVSVQTDRIFTLPFTTVGKSSCIVMEFSAKSMLLKGQQDTDSMNVTDPSQSHQNVFLGICVL